MPISDAKLKLTPRGAATKRRRLVAIGSSFLGLLALPHAHAGEMILCASSLIKSVDPTFGNPRGKITIVDFYDIRCPPCRAMAPRIKRLLRKDHEVRYVPIDYPLLGAPSLLATEALFAAQEQGKYAQMRARLLTQKRLPTEAVIKADAKALGLDWDRMEFAMSGDVVAHRIAANMALGRRLEVKEIPTMFINGRKITGALSYSDLVSVVAEAHSCAR